MRKTLIASALALLGLSAAVPVQAMPIVPLSAGLPGVTTVAYGCGPGWTRGVYGRCHPVHGYVATVPGVVVAPAPGVVVAAPGVVVGHPYHRCWWRAGVKVCN